MLQLNFESFPELTTKRLLLRKISTNDVNEIFSMRSNKNIMRFIARPLAKTKDDAFTFIQTIDDALKNNDGVTWGITFKTDSTLVGTIGFWRIQKEHHRAEIGYMLNDLFHRQGIMLEAIKTVLDFGFRVMRLHSAEANVDPKNVASIRLLEKNNFVLEGHFKENYYYKGKFLDSYTYSLLKPNFTKHFC